MAPCARLQEDVFILVVPLPTGIVEADRTSVSVHGTVQHKMRKMLIITLKAHTL
jgi:hypothetical protein